MMRSERDSEDSEVDISEIKSQCLAQYKKVSEKRFKRFSSGYRIDRWIFQVAMFTIFGYLFFVAHSYNYDLDYYKCGSQDTPEYIKQNLAQQDCKNPFYKEPTWKNQEYLPPGEYGTKLGPLFHSAYYSPFLLFGIALLLNHIIHNRKEARR